MSHNSFIDALSHPRFGRYLFACNQDIKRAIELYRANMELSKQLYAIIGVFEIALRNAINKHYLATMGDEWLLRGIQEGGYLYKSKGLDYTFYTVQSAMKSLGLQYSHDRLVAKLPFGFWAYQFAKKEYASAGSTLIKVFVKRPFATNQKEIHDGLVKIGKIRNRIAHYEPVCFKTGTSVISTQLVKNRYDTMKQMLRWLGYEPSTLLHEIDHVNEAIQRIEQFRENKFKWLVDYLLRFPRQEKHYSFGQG